MTEPISNFAYLMDLLEIQPRDLSIQLGADLSLVSRWRTGKRRLMPNRHWVQDIALYFHLVDITRSKPLLADLLRIYYPSGTFDTDEAIRTHLEDFLTAAQQTTEKYHHARALRLSKLDMRQEHTASEIFRGIAGVQMAALAFLDYVMAMPEPQEIIFACPEGLDIYTRDEAFSRRLIERLMQVFRSGHRLRVVLRTDYKISDVSSFAGPWLLAHLLGYIESSYYDDFRKISVEKMMAVIKDKVAMRVWGDEKNLVREMTAQYYFDQNTLTEVYRQSLQYCTLSIKRFHYRFFPQPDMFLRDITGLFEQSSYLFTFLPHFCVSYGAEFIKQFALNEEEYLKLQRDFQPLLQSPALLPHSYKVRHIFCEEEIESALMKPRHVSYELSVMTGRRVFMTSQSLAAQLVHLKQLLADHPNYEVCFLRREHFDQFILQIGVWGDKAAIGWVRSGMSTACKDYTNVGALHGFCATIWDHIPDILKSRAASTRKLNSFLKKARRQGHL